MVADGAASEAEGAGATAGAGVGVATGFFFFAIGFFGVSIVKGRSSGRQISVGKDGL